VIGTLLGERYRLDAEIGRGGMSTVYRAFDTVLERPVAIKLMHREIATDSDQLERFRREARAVAQLSHPHIVTVIDAGEEPSAHGGAGQSHEPEVGTPYIVLEYVDGETLKDHIRRDGPLDIPQAIAYAIEIARALAELSGKARSGKLAGADMQGGSFTISSLGGIGGTAFTPIINAPEVAILGVSRSAIKPVFRDGGFVPRMILPLSLSYDHRMIDGANGARFTSYLSNALADARGLTEAVP